MVSSEIAIDMSAPEHPIERLRRADRHSLGAGEGILFAHPHPRWLHRPGLWDGVQWYTHRIRPAYTLSILDSNSRDIPLRESFRSWTPAMLVASFVGGAIQLTERRVILDGGRTLSDCTVVNGSGRRETLGIAVWTAQEGIDIPDRSLCRSTGDDGIGFRVNAPDVQQRNHRLALDAILQLEPCPDLRLLLETQHARGSENLPEWSIAPLRERMSGARDVVHSIDNRPTGNGRTLLYFGLIRNIVIEPGQSLSFTACLQVAPVDESTNDARREQFGDERAARSNDSRAKRTPSSGTPPRHLPNAVLGAADASNQHWRRFFETAPDLVSSDPHLGRFFAHRWYGLRLNFLSPCGLYRRPTCAEGTEFFHQAISYSAWTHARELRWLDATRARGVMETFFDHQNADGSYPGLIYVDGVHPTANYLGDWGGSLDALEEAHPDRDFLQRAWRSLSRYAAWLSRDRDPDATGLYRVRDPYETGQEYMSRYIAVQQDADTQHFDYALDLFGIDVTVYAYRLHRALERAARRLHQRESRRAHERTADRIGDAILARLWDPRTGLFSDVDPRSGEPTGIKAAICFYPWMTDLPGPAHLAGLEKHLFDPRAFWTPVPVPSTAADDSTYDPDGYWKGVRRNCPWNGRVWPMTNCHVAEALATTAISHAPHLRRAAADLILRTVRMMFFDGDPARPNSFEHYSPVTGEPCAWRGLDDYQHSWLNDQIVRWIVGFRPDADGFVVDPLPADIAHARIERLPFRGSLLDVGFNEHTVFAACDGRRLEVTRPETLRVGMHEFERR
jgi:hypothetical protein